MAPGHGTTWAGSFGDLPLCVRTPGVRVVLQGVRFHSPGLRDAHAWLRTTSAADVKGLPGSEVARYGPFISVRGTPPQFTGRRDDPLGQFSTHFAGVPVTATCAQSSRGVNQLLAGRIPTTPVQELVFSARTGPAGGRFTDGYVDYTANSKPARLELGWDMTLCGNQPRGGRALQLRFADRPNVCAFALAFERLCE